MFEWFHDENMLTKNPVFANVLAKGELSWIVLGEHLVLRNQRKLNSGESTCRQSI
jgi:hypothetical protein